MTEILQVLALAQSSGGLLLFAGFGIVKLIRIEKDFIKHRHEAKTGKLFIDVN